MDLISIYNLLLRRIWYIILIPVVTGIMAVFLSGILPKQYLSVAKLSTGFTTKSGISLDDDRFNFAQIVMDFSNLIETMKSEIILNSVSANLLIHDLNSDSPFRLNPDSINYYKSHIDSSYLKNKKDSFLLIFPPNKEGLYVKDLLESHGYLGWQLLGNLNIHRVRDTDFVNIEYTSENPYLSAFIVNSIANELIRYYTFTNSVLSNKSVIFFQKEVDKKRDILNNQIEQINQYKRSHPVQDDVEKSANMSKLAQYEILRDETLRKITTLQLSLANLTEQLKKANRVNQSANNQRIIDLRNKLNELTQLYIDGGSSDKKLEQAIANVRNQLAVEMRLLDANSSSTTKSADEISEEIDAKQLEVNIENANLKRLNEQIGSIKAETTLTPNSAELGALEKQLDDAMSEYQNAVDRLDLEKSKSLLTASTVKVVVKGQPKLEPESQKRKLIILFAVFTSFVLVVAIIVGLDLVDIRIKSQKDFISKIPINFLGQLNRIDLQKFLISKVFETKGNPTNETFKQLLRKLRHNVELQAKQCIVVTSPNTGDGKTFSIISLAYSLSLIEKKVLIIDTNFKNNSLTKLLAPNSKVILLNSARVLKNTLLIGKGDKSEDGDDQEKPQQSIMSRTIYKNIDLIGNNGGVDSPLELFSGRDFNTMIAKLKEIYDYIILEGPALNDYPDTMELIEFSDGVISVVKAGTIVKQKDKESFSYLKSLNGKLVGGILNQVDEKELNL